MRDARPRLLSSSQLFEAERGVLGARTRPTREMSPLLGCAPQTPQLFRRVSPRKVEVNVKKTANDYFLQMFVRLYKLHATSSRFGSK